MRATRLATVATIAWLAVGCGNDLGEFDGLNCTIPSSRFYTGAPGRDAIPALTNPALTPPSEARFLVDASRVLGLEINGTARAYPLPILWWHELVNDTLGGENVLVSYCPLTGSGLAFDPRVGGRLRNFGVSGLLFENNLVMFDRETESLWNQLLLGSQCGPEAGGDLARLPVVETSWKQWREAHSETTVLSVDTGHNLSYGIYPYADYAWIFNPETLFPGSDFRDDRPPKELVLGVREGTTTIAYPFGVLSTKGLGVAVNDVIDGRPVVVTYAQREETARVFDSRIGAQTLTFAVADSVALTLTDLETGSTWDWRGVAIAGTLEGERLTPLQDAWTLFWFAWSVYYPETEVY